MSDGIIHAAFNHDFSRFAENSDAHRRATEAMGDVLAGSDRPAIVTAGVPFTSGHVTTEDGAPPAGPSGSPRVSEQAVMSLVARGVHVSVIRIKQLWEKTPAADWRRPTTATYWLRCASQIFFS